MSEGEIPGTEHEKIGYLHVPKTGGAAMCYFFYEQLRRVRRNYFLSFTGVDDSRDIQDEWSTKRERGNWCIVERMAERPALADEFRHSPHFAQARMVFGHQTSFLAAIFPEYRWRFVAVLREPIERTISNIVQFANFDVGSRLGHHKFAAEACSDEYWEAVYRVLTSEYPIEGLATHENFYLRNGMTHILQGSSYRDPAEAPDVFRALAMGFRMQLAIYENLNVGLQRCFDALGVPVDMSKNTKAAAGAPPVSTRKQSLGRYYNAPQKVLDFVAETNQLDLQLYEMLGARIREADAAFVASASPR